MPVDTKLYEILQVEPNASVNEIKKQYKKLARQYHPDKAGPQYEEKFKEISFAHEVLTDPEKKDLYDRYGERGLQEGGMGPGMDDVLNHIFGHGGGMGSMFGGFSPFGMGGMGGMGGRRRNQRRRGEDTKHQLQVKLEDLYNGKVSKLKLRKKVICSTCDGAGGKGNAVQRCYSCNGNGMKISIQPLGPGMVQQVQRICPDCSGEGEVIDAKNRCKKCLGKKVVEETKILEVTVGKGTRDGQKITFRGEGDQQPGVETGDVIIIVQQKPHDLFTRKGDDLYMKLDVGLTEALCGFKIPVEHLDGRELLITNLGGKVVDPGCQRVLLNEGMPKHHDPTDKGHLYIEFNIRFPPNNFIELDMLKNLEKLLPDRVIEMDIPEISEMVDEVTLGEYVPTQRTDGHGHRDAYDDDDDEDMGHGHGHGPGVQCATQ